MKRAQQQSSRVPSPTPTTFSEFLTIEPFISPNQQSSQPAVPSLDPRIIARTHFDELSRYLAAYLARVSSAHLKHHESYLSIKRCRRLQIPLNRTAETHEADKQQFQELSTDVYDETYPSEKELERERRSVNLSSHSPICVDIIF